MEDFANTERVDFPFLRREVYVVDPYEVLGPEEAYLYGHLGFRTRERHPAATLVVNHDRSSCTIERAR